MTLYIFELSFQYHEANSNPIYEIQDTTSSKKDGQVKPPIEDLTKNKQKKLRMLLESSL